MLKNERDITAPAQNSSTCSIPLRANMADEFPESREKYRESDGPLRPEA
jgi:hypothetical protein